jgi:hypothetical protein
MSFRNLSPSAVLLVAALGSLACLSAAAADKEVKAADVPKVVADAVAKQYPGGKVTRWTSDTKDGKTTYEAKVEITSKDKDKKDVVRTVEADVTAEGKVVAEEEDLKPDALPADVRKAIAGGKFAKAKITRAERMATGEKLEVVQYEVKFDVDGKTFEVTFDAAGKVLEEEGPEGDEGDEKKEEK